MGKIYRFEDGLARDVVTVRDTFVELPARFDPSAAAYTDATETVEIEAEAEPEFDPEALRAEVLAEARDEAARKVQEAYAEGYERGMQQGREAFDARLGDCEQALQAAAQTMATARETFLAQLEPQVVELARLVAKRVLDREVRTDPELIQRTVRRALEKLAGAERVTLRLHPQDLEALEAEEVSLLDDLRSEFDLTIEADPDVSPGGCIADSASLHVDAQAETLLEDVLTLLDE